MTRNTMRRTRLSKGAWLAACLGALVVSYSAGLHAQPSKDELAETHFRSGAAYLAESDYENALRAFQKAYELSKRPELLINIATVHERMNQLESAVASLEQYLREDPEGKHAETVKIRIENLKRRMAEQQQSAAPAPATEAPAAVAPAPAETAAEPPSPVTEPERRPSNTLAFVSFGIAGVGAVGAIATGLAAQNKHNSLEEECAPHCSEGSLRPGKTMAWTSTALTGVAIVAAGVGVTLLVVNRGRSERAPRPTARLELGAGARGVGATARLEF